MSTSKEVFNGELVDAIFTATDQDAYDQLMVRTGEFLNMLDHCARWHVQVVTGDYLGDVLDDLDHIRLKHNLPEPIHPAMQ